MPAVEDLGERDVFGVVGLGPAEVVGEAPGAVVDAGSGATVRLLVSVEGDHPVR
jgi:hypothetical protein